MKTLSKEETEKAGLIKNGRTTKVRAHLIDLQVGEALIIEKGVDWTRKSAPYRIVNYYQKQSKRRFETGRTTDSKGWIVKRIE